VLTVSIYRYGNPEKALIKYQRPPWLPPDPPTEVNRKRLVVSFHFSLLFRDTQLYYVIQENTTKLQSDDAVNLALTHQKAVIEINRSSRILEDVSLDLDGTRMEMDDEHSESKRTSSEGYLGDDDDDYDVTEDMVEWRMDVG